MRWRVWEELKVGVEESWVQWRSGREVERVGERGERGGVTRKERV